MSTPSKYLEESEVLLVVGCDIEWLREWNWRRLHYKDGPVSHCLSEVAKINRDWHAEQRVQP